MNIFTNKKEWNTFTPDQMKAYEEEVFNWYRTNGFPHWPTDEDFRNNEFRKLMNYRHKIIFDDTLKQTMHGLSLAWSYFPHAWEVKSNNLLSPMEAFNDDDLLRKVIKKVINYHDCMSHNSFRKALKMLGGVQGVSNFRPTAASALYTRYAAGGTVLDMSSGWGGRLLGFVHSQASEYIGYEPSTKTHSGLQELARDYAGIFHSIDIHNKGSEFIDLPVGSVDFAFTSPPYFDLEKYADEPTQSYQKFPTLEKWRVGFLEETFTRVHKSLKDGHRMAINIADTKKYHLEEITKKAAEHTGFELEETLKLSLSNPNFDKDRDVHFKYEPIMIFKKR